MTLTQKYTEGAKDASGRIFVSPGEYAEMLGCSKSTVLRQINAGAIKAHRIGPKTFRISLEDALAT